MNTGNITILMLAAIVISLHTVAAEEGNQFPKRAGKQEGKGGPDGRGAGMREKMMMRRFDKNKDGKLDKAEKDVMQKHKKEVLEKYDKDGDGKLGPEERKAAIEAHRKNMAERGRKGHKLQRRKKMMEKFDEDGDGKLSEEEREKMRETMKKHMRKQAEDE